ncbi:MAG: oligosaccharide flippase family protein [Patescibacteria group bacterium]
MWARFLRFIKSKDSVNIAVNTAGNYLNVFFIAIFALILVRIMHPVEYGVLSVLLGIIYVMANVLDFGVTANIYSTLPGLVHKNREISFRFLKSNILYQSILSVIVILLLIIFFPQLDRLFFKTGESRLILNLTAISIILFLWQNSVMNIFFATKKFLKANLYLNSANVIKTIILGFLIYFNFISVGSIIFVFGILGPFLFLIFVLFGKSKDISLFIKSPVSKTDFKFKYSFPYFLGSQFFNMGLRMDLFMLSFFGLGAGVGFYGLAQKIVLTIVTTIVSVTQVLTPNFSRLKTKKETKLLLKESFTYLLIPVGLYIILFFTPNQLFNFVFTKEYAPTALITKSLVFPYIIFTLGQLPFLYILYVARKTTYILYSNIVFFLGMTFGSLYLIPKLGVFAPAYVLSISLFISIMIQTIAAIYEYKKLPE